MIKKSILVITALLLFITPCLAQRPGQQPPVETPLTKYVKGGLMHPIVQIRPDAAMVWVSPAWFQMDSESKFKFCNEVIQVAGAPQVWVYNQTNGDIITILKKGDSVMRSPQ